MMDQSFSCFCHSFAIQNEKDELHSLYSEEYYEDENMMYVKHFEFL